MNRLAKDVILHLPAAELRVWIGVWLQMYENEIFPGIPPADLRDTLPMRPSVLARALHRLDARGLIGRKTLFGGEEGMEERFFLVDPLKIVGDLRQELD